LATVAVSCAAEAAEAAAEVTVLVTGLEAGGGVAVAALVGVVEGT